VKTERKMIEIVQEHAVSVEWFPNNHGYPHRAECSCGWVSRGFVKYESAGLMGNEHLKSTGG
jgi:hypothetical protein